MNIPEIIEEHNYPTENNLRKIIKKQYPHITPADIDEFFNIEQQEQVLKKKVKTKLGKIVANFPNERWNIDLLMMDKYKKYNTHKHILFAIDIFTRYVYAEPINSKTSADVIEAFQNILDKAKAKPILIISDSERAFLSNDFSQLLDNNDIILQTVPIGDHNTLGVIDRFSLTFRNIIQRKFSRTKNMNWDKSLQSIIEKYNNTEHRGIMNLKPKDAGNKVNTLELMLENQLKHIHNQELPHNIKNSLKIGDKVRMNIGNKTFKKGSEPQFSNEVYTVDSVKGKKFSLEGVENWQHIDNLNKVPQNNKTLTRMENPVNELNKQRRNERRFRDINEDNIIKNSRRLRG